MGVLIQIRDVPEDVHRKLKSRAAAAGKSLSAYVREELELAVSRPTIEEFTAHIKARGSVDLGESTAAAVRHIRDHGE